MQALVQRDACGAYTASEAWRHHQTNAGQSTWYTTQSRFLVRLLGSCTNAAAGTEPVSEIGKFYSSKMKPIGQCNGNWFHDWDVYMYPNVTNLHLHGLHVDLAEDNVTRRCEPQEQIQSDPPPHHHHHQHTHTSQTNAHTHTL